MQQEIEVISHRSSWVEDASAILGIILMVVIMLGLGVYPMVKGGLVMTTMMSGGWTIGIMVGFMCLGVFVVWIGLLDNIHMTIQTGFLWAYSINFIISLVITFVFPRSPIHILWGVIAAPYVGIIMLGVILTLATKAIELSRGR